MSFIPMGFYKTPAGGYTPTDTDAIAYISEVETQGGTLSDTDKEAVDDLYIGLKADSIYTKLKVMYPFMGAISQSTAINGISPTDADTTISWALDLTGSANHTTAGITIPSGDEGYGDIADAPSDLLSSVNDASIGHYASDVLSGNGFVVAPSANTTSAGVRFQMYAESGGNLYPAIGNASFASYDNGSAPIGRWIISRDSSTSLVLYKNGAEVGTSVESNSGASLNTNSLRFFNASIASANEVRGTYGFLFVGEGLDSTEAVNMDTAISTFLTDIGR